MAICNPKVVHWAAVTGWVLMTLSAQASVAPDFLPPVTAPMSVLNAAQQQNRTLLQIPGFEARGALTQAMERRQGEKILREINRQMRVLDDPWISSELEAMVSRLVAVAGMPMPMTLLVIDDPRINAFAVTGSIVAVNSGLILSARTPDELAGVLAHELAHVHQHHFERRMQELKRSRWLMVGGLLAGLAASQQDQDLGAAMITGTQALTVDRELAFSRSQEHEADRIGLQLLQGAGYDPQAMADFFETMQRNNALPGYVPDFVLTHPLSRERVSEARSRTARLARPPADPDAQQRFGLLQGRVAVLTLRASASELNAKSNRTEAEQVTLAWLLAQQKQPAAAQALLVPVLRRHPDWVAAQVVAAQIQLLQPQMQRPPEVSPTATGIAVLRQRWPTLPVSRWVQAQWAVAQQQPEQAITWLKPLTRQYPYQRSYWELLEQAAVQARRPAAEVLSYRAERLNLLGDLDGAIIALERAETLLRSGTASGSGPELALDRELGRSIATRLASWREQR